MPWKERTALEERERFVREYESGLWTMAELCRRYGVTRPVGYKYWKRYRAGEGLEERSRAPHRHPNRVREQIEEQLLEVRRRHGRWGARKIRAYLQERQPSAPWPAASTIHELLDGEGLVVHRRPRRTPPATAPFAELDQCNRVWCVDFKGWFRTGDGRRCDPLTLSDAFSRYLLRGQALEGTSGEHVRAVLEAVFREYGMPERIRSDNGAPFAARGLGGLSRLSIWWLKLGIAPERIRPGHPEQNGRHERLHRTLKEETAQPPAAHRRAQQAAFHHFLQEYNQERPHEALSNRTPASVYVPSPRPYPARLPEMEYPAEFAVRRVQKHGQIWWRGCDGIFLSETLAGEPVGLKAIDDRYYQVYFGPMLLGILDNWKQKVKRPGPTAGNRVGSQAVAVSGPDLRSAPVRPANGGDSRPEV